MCIYSLYVKQNELKMFSTSKNVFIKDKTPAKLLTTT